MKKITLLSLVALTTVSSLSSTFAASTSTESITQEIASLQNSPVIAQYNTIRDTQDAFLKHMTDAELAHTNAIWASVDAKTHDFLVAKGVPMVPANLTTKVDAGIALTDAEDSELMNAYLAQSEYIENHFTDAEKAAYNAIAAEGNTTFNTYMQSIGFPVMPTDIEQEAFTKLKKIDNLYKELSENQSVL